MSIAIPGWIAAFALPGALACASALAQLPDKPPLTVDAKAPPAPPPQGTPAVPVVTVSGERPTNRIDRQVYDVQADVGSSNGSAADALGSVPSVVVDPDGSLTLRGSPNVQIYIDGKPSAMMQGDNRGAALAAIPAEDIESIEVINNPGAQFGNEGGGGPIINIVMRRSRKPGGFGVVNTNGGTAGRYNAAASGSYNQGLWGAQGGISLRHDGRNAEGFAERERTDIVTGALSHSTQASHSAGLNDNAGINGSLRYNLGERDTLGTNLAYSARSNDQQAQDHYHNSDQALATVSDYVRNTVRAGDSHSASGGAHWDHKGLIDGETLKLDLRVSSSHNASENAYANQYNYSASGTLDSQSRQANDSANQIIDFSGDYERPDGRGVLKLGYKAARHASDQGTLYTNIDPASLAESLNTARSNRFRLAETTLALYASYQVRLNASWGLLAGLRAERTGLDIEQLTSQIFAANRFLNLIPSLFASYRASDNTIVRFSYAHRIRRPNSGDLNPFVVYRDELNVSSGNPKLKPAQTDSFELGLETRVGTLETNLRAYFRKENDTILDRKYFISDTVLLTTRENAGSNRASGLELTASGKLLPALTLNASANLAHNELTVLDALGMPATHSVMALSGRTRLNWQATVDDQVQATLQTLGRSLAGQGVRQPNATANFGLRHAITPRLFLVMNVTDAFNTNKIETLTDTSTLREDNVRRYDGRLIYLGLSYRLGGMTPVRR
ncbi:MAG: outer membrane beta-barrel family protein [Pseudomonadota bacterium]